MEQTPEEKAQEIIEAELEARTGVLNLNGLGLKKVPELVRELTWLRVICLGEYNYWNLKEEQLDTEFKECRPNSIECLPDWFAQFQALSVLTVDDTQINNLALPTNLTSLQHINCSGTPVSDLNPLSGLPDLQHISCGGTQVSDLSPLSGLSSLQHVSCDNTQVSDLSPLSGLLGLRGISCNNTEVSDLSPLSDLSDLYYIFCNRTMVSDLSPLSGLSSLVYVNCVDTPVSDLSPLKNQLKQGLHVSSHGCPLFIPPPEFAEQGQESIVEYFNQLDEDDGASSLNEIKIILLGEGTAGKTSLVRRLQGQGFNPKEGQTHGIRIRKQLFDIDDEQATARIWDFGGQETMHATHQFFLSERCIYVLVLNSRQGEDRDKAEYWLKHARSYGGNSPVLMVLNKIDENRAFEMDRRFLSEKYPQIQDYYRLSCKTGEGVDEFRQGLLSQIEQAKSRKTPFPTAWSRVKKHFDSLDEDYINNAAYQQICHEHNVDKPLSQSVLLNFLHDLGVLVNFDKLLQYCDMQILNPLWLTNGVYRVVTSSRVADNHGLLLRGELDEVINGEVQEADNTLEEPYLYPKDKLPIIIEVMQKFELCYQLDHAHYVIPSLLAKEEPEFCLEGAVIHFEVHFSDFLPPGLFPRLMVKLHHYIDGTNNWRSGMFLHKPEVFNARARIQVDREDKKLIIHCCGEEPRKLLSFIRKTVEEVAGSYAQLEYDEKVVVPNESKQRVFKDYDDLVIHEEEGEETIFVSELRQRISVSDILDGVEDPKMRDKEAQTPVKAFISYSRKDSEGLEKLISALAPAQHLGNLELWHDKAIDAGEEWEKTIFDELEQSDIVLCLISADFINSDFCNRELNKSLARHAKGLQRVIPVQWRSCNWDGLPIAGLQGLVNESIRSLPEHERDDAWTAAAKKLDPQIEEVRKVVLSRPERRHGRDW
uniref:non-specific serine/threonine protein kinase n=1 Tax=uncultured Thiotrichaceae bacterium TaxID=298394 RepID=A0A6S6TRP9_9GAMM|nr:MAG: GTP-binding protein [uncultured Thiotrichaceae bacterium]